MSEPDDRSPPDELGFLRELAPKPPPAPAAPADPMAGYAANQELDVSILYQGKPRRRDLPRWQQRLLGALDGGGRALRWMSSPVNLMIAAGVAVLAAPLLWLLYQYAQLVRAVWPAWPILGTFAVAVLLTGLAQSLGRWYQRSSSPLPHSAGAWLLERLAQEPALGASLQELDKPGEENFYLPASRAIVLGAKVRDSCSAAAHAVAAHELGHALMHHRAPRLERFTLACRAQADRPFFWGMMLLFAASLHGDALAMDLARPLIAASVLLRIIVCVDELIASRLALRELRRHGLDAEHLRTSRRYLVAAFSTYAAAAAAYALPLLSWGWFERRFADGFLAPGAPLSCTGAAFASAAAVAVLVGLLGSLLLLPSWKPDSRLRKGVLIVSALCCLFGPPLLLGHLADQPLGFAEPWAVLLAVIPSFYLSIPVWLGVAMLVALLPQLEIPTAPVRPPPTLRKLSLESLREPPSRLLGNLRSLGMMAMAVPLALIYLLR